MCIIQLSVQCCTCLRTPREIPHLWPYLEWTAKSVHRRCLVINEWHCILLAQDFSGVNCLWVHSILRQTSRDYFILNRFNRLREGIRRYRCEHNCIYQFLHMLMPQTRISVWNARLQTARLIEILISSTMIESKMNLVIMKVKIIFVLNAFPRRTNEGLMAFYREKNPTSY